MTTKLKLYIGRKVLDSIQKSSNVTATQLKSLMQVESAKAEDKPVEMSMSLSLLETKFGIANVNKILKIQPDDIIQHIHCIKDRSNRRICFQINKDIFLKEIIEHSKFPDLSSHQKKKIVIDFSSPNVAKPFHVGHLRSTIIGNFIANVNDYINNNVIRINYLGDWGTQFGMIKVGVDKLQHTTDDIKENPIQLLYESYVHANKLAETDPEILEEAKKLFSKLENGSEQEINDWKTYMNFAVDELDKVYNRLGVKFTQYDFESMYGAKEIQDIVDAMETKRVLATLPNGNKVATINDRKVSVIKSDGTTLYLTRDIAAAIDRFNKFEFDRMYYVVDNSQSDHFTSLKGILHQMDYPWVDRIRHVKFGRVRGMNTRKGNAVFLKDILDESRDLMIQRQLNSPTTKVSLSDSTTSDILGMSCVIVNDLKQRRQKDYEFSWDKALQAQGDSGIKLQYTHCRLCNLEENCGAIPAKICIPALLTEPEVILLVRELARFHDIVYRAEEQLEACILVTYLFHLCNHINKALKTIKVKDQDEVMASQRLMLFNTSREVLKQGMIILGLQPLTKM